MAAISSSRRSWAGVLQRGAAHQLHGDARRPVAGIHVVDSAYVGAVQAGMELGLVHEPDHGRGFQVLEDLQGHRPGQDGVPGFVHVAHGAVAQERADDVAALPASLGVEPGGLGIGFGQGDRAGKGAGAVYVYEFKASLPSGHRNDRSGFAECYIKFIQAGYKVSCNNISNK